MNTETNKAIVRGWYGRGLGTGDLALADAYYAPEFINYPSGRRSSPAQARQFVAALHAALPDLTVRIEELIAEGDRVVICFTCGGTHSGVFGDFPPTGQAVRFTEVCILRFADGKVIERRVAFEGASLLEQLGARVASA